jgi:hypothetical protein
MLSMALSTDREATQIFSLRNILTTHCGQKLTPELLEQIVAEMVLEMRQGPTAWAFSEKS